jgi:hypothetical protein
MLFVQELITELQDQESFGKRGEAWAFGELAAVLLLLIPPFGLVVSLQQPTNFVPHSSTLSSVTLNQCSNICISNCCSLKNLPCGSRDSHLFPCVSVQGLVDILGTLLITAGLVFM